jgi:hypothetical protein
MVNFKRNCTWHNLQDITGVGRSGCCVGRYGMKEAARAWHLNFKGALSKAGFAVSQAGPSLFVLTHEGSQAYLLVYADNAVSAGNHDQVATVKDVLELQSW